MALLASYYGTQPSMDSSAEGKDNPLDLDSASFDAQAYSKVRHVDSTPNNVPVNVIITSLLGVCALCLLLQKILLSHSVAELMDRDAQLSSEIKLLDGDMQMLVYENYSKFISATETIRRMKVRAREIWELGLYILTSIVPCRKTLRLWRTRCNT